MDIIIAQFKSDFKDRFKCDFPDSQLLSLVAGELEERKKSMIKSQLLGRTTSDLIAICALLEEAVNQSLDRQLIPSEQDLKNAIDAVNKHDKKKRKH